MNTSDDDVSDLVPQETLTSPLERTIKGRDIRINEEAKICASDLNSLASLFVDTAEKISFFSRRTASTLLGGALGGVIGILCVSSEIPIQKQYENIFVFFSATGGAGIGCLCIRETREERARRVENAAIKIAKIDQMEDFKNSLAVQHAALTSGDVEHVLRKL